MTIPPSWPLDSPEHLAEALREQGTTPEDREVLTPALLRLTEWQAPRPTATDTQRLLACLIPSLPAISPVRQAIRDRSRSQQGRLVALLEVARVQVSLVRPAFWLVSVLVLCAGVAAILEGPRLGYSQTLRSLFDQSLLLRALGPLLVYLGTITVFRGASLRVLEFELSCQPTPVQLTLARLLIVLGYDVGLGLLLSLALWSLGSGGFLLLTLHWLMPLLLVAGLALLLSLRLDVYRAASLAYGGWLALLLLDMQAPVFGSPPIVPLTSLAEVIFGLAGVACLALALLRLEQNLARMLPRT
ncbi:MAG TPA: hypothetical protein VH540_15860 [Ktedonobacterales bacterium]|jgi:hypothetical protein